MAATEIGIGRPGSQPTRGQMGFGADARYPQPMRRRLHRAAAQDDPAAVETVCIAGQLDLQRLGLCGKAQRRFARRDHDLERRQARLQVLLPCDRTIRQLCADQRGGCRLHVDRQPVEVNVVGPAQGTCLQRALLAHHQTEVTCGQADVQTSARNPGFERQPRPRRPGARQIEIERAFPVLEGAGALRSDRGAFETQIRPFNIAQSDLGIGHHELAHPPVRVHGQGRAQSGLQVRPCGGQRELAAALHQNFLVAKTRRNADRPGELDLPWRRQQRGDSIPFGCDRLELDAGAGERGVKLAALEDERELACTLEPARNSRQAQPLGPQLQAARRGGLAGKRLLVQRHLAFDPQICPELSRRCGQLGALRLRARTPPGPAPDGAPPQTG